MSTHALVIISCAVALVVIAALAAALILVRRALAQTSENLSTLAGALEGVEADHLRPLEPAVKAINEQFDIIVSALPQIASKAAVVAERRPS